MVLEEWMDFIPIICMAYTNRELSSLGPMIFYCKYSILSELVQLRSELYGFIYLEITS